MEFKIESSNKKILTFFKHVMPNMLDALKLSNSRRAVLVKVTDDTPEGIEGSTVPIDWADCYLVLVKPPARITTSSLLAVTQTLTHEMIHVRQLAKGILKFTPDNGRIWQGQYYSADTPYLDQPWELDAFAKTEITFRRVIEI